MSPSIRRPFKPDGCTSLHVKPVILGPGKLLRWRPARSPGPAPYPLGTSRTVTVDKLAIKMISL